MKVRFEVPSDRAVPLSVNREPGRASASRAPTSRRPCARWRRSSQPAEAAKAPKRRPVQARLVRWVSTIDSSPGTARSRPEEASDAAQRDAGARAARRAAIRPVRRAEDAHPPCVHREARAGALQRPTTQDLTDRVLRVVTEQLALDRTPLTRDEREQLVREITDDILGYGPIEPLLRDDTVSEVMVNGPDQIYVERRASSSSRSRPSSTSPPAAHHRQDRLPGRSAHRRGLADGRCAPARRQPRERDHSAALASGAGRHDPEVLARPLHDGRPDRLRHAHAARRRTSSPRA